MAGKAGNIEELQRYDRDDMFSVIKKFPKQVKEACEIGNKCPAFKKSPKITKIVVLGMGGSAIGGDLIRSYAAATLGADNLQILINRNYSLPAFVDKDTHVIASSYSGNTEETLTAFDEAVKRTKNIMVISSGGELTKKAEAKKLPVIQIPGGLQPRAALGYSFFPLIYMLMRSGAFENKAVKETESAIEETQSIIEVKSKEYSRLAAQNPAVNLASKLYGKIPAIYSSIDRLDTVNLRWRGQIQENAKNAVYGNYLPEMNHNEINAWSHPDSIRKSGVPVFLTDPDDNPKIAKRFEALELILKEKGYKILKPETTGKHLLTRMFELIYLADWTSYYLALLNRVNPTPIPLIDRLKEFLAKNKA